MPPLHIQRFAYKSSINYPGNRVKRISYKTTKAYRQNGFVIPERLQIKASVKPTLEATIGMPELAALNHDNNSNTVRLITIDVMQRMIHQQCEGSHFDILYYKEKEENKENTPQSNMGQHVYIIRPMRLYNTNNFSPSEWTVKFRVARSTSTCLTEAEYDFIVDMSPGNGDSEVDAIKSACEEAIYRLDALHVVDTLNDIVTYESPIDMPFITFGARLYHSSPVDKKLGNVQSTVKKTGFTTPHPRTEVTLDDVLNIPGYKGIDYPHYCCPASLVTLYKEKAIKGYTPEISNATPSPATQLRMMKNGKFKYQNYK